METESNYTITRYLNSIRWVLLVIFLAFLLMSFLHGSLLYAALNEVKGITDELRIGGAVIGGLVLASLMLTASIFKKYLSWTISEGKEKKQWHFMPYLLASLESVALGKLLWRTPFEAILLSLALGIGLTVIAFIFEKLSNPIMELHSIEQNLAKVEREQSEAEQSLSDLQKRRAQAEQNKSEAERQLSEFKAIYRPLILESMKKLTCPACGKKIKSNTDQAWSGHTGSCGNRELLAELKEWAKEEV